MKLEVSPAALAEIAKVGFDPVFGAGRSSAGDPAAHREPGDRVSRCIGHRGEAVRCRGRQSRRSTALALRQRPLPLELEHAAARHTLEFAELVHVAVEPAGRSAAARALRWRHQVGTAKRGAAIGRRRRSRHVASAAGSCAGAATGRAGLGRTPARPAAVPATARGSAPMRR